LSTYTVNEHTFQKANNSLKMFFFYWSYEVLEFVEIVNWWDFVKAKIITIKITKDLNYFSLCAFNLFNIRVSQFELNY